MCVFIFWWIDWCFFTVRIKWWVGGLGALWKPIKFQEKDYPNPKFYNSCHNSRESLANTEYCQDVVLACIGSGFVTPISHVLHWLRLDTPISHEIFFHSSRERCASPPSMIGMIDGGGALPINHPSNNQYGRRGEHCW